MERIKTERLILRTVTLDDADDIFAYSSEADVGPDAGWKPHESKAETVEVIKELFENKKGIFGITEKNSTKVIGTVGLVDDPKRSNPYAKLIGYAMGHEYWGKGYMTEAVKAVVRYGFEELSLSVISAYCYTYNEASRRVLEKNGFEYEGTLNLCELRFDGAVLANDCYSLSREEWLEFTAQSR